MKKYFFLVLMCFGTASICSSQATKQIFSSPSLSATLAKAKTVAILPFNVAISYKKMPKGVTVENIREDEKKEGPQMQQGMYTFLLRKMNDYSVTFQDVERTNALLKKAGLIDNLNETLADSLCKILGVDAVIKSSWSYAKTGSEAGAIATALVFGVSKGVGSGQLVMQIYDGNSGEMVWRMAKEMNESVYSSANELMERMMRKVGRNFPFEK